MKHRAATQDTSELLRPYLWPVGRAGMVDPGRVVAVGLYRSAPIRRAAQTARSQGRLIDLTGGALCRWVLFLDSGHVALASEPMPVTADDSDRIAPDDLP